MISRTLGVARLVGGLATPAVVKDRPEPAPAPAEAARPPAPAAPTGEPGQAPAATPVAPPPAALVPAATPKLVGSGFRFTEGPLWRDGTLLFSDIDANTIYTIRPEDEPARPGDAERFRTPSGSANGNTLDGKGRLITAQHDGKLTRTEADGSVTVLASKYEGKRLNSPNDVVVHSGGAIYFTDPSFGVSRAERQLDFCGVFRLVPAEEPGGEHTLTLLTRDLQLPNGLAFSPDEKRLYVTDHRKAEIHAFDVGADGNLSNGRLFVDLKAPPTRGATDGMKVDSKGNIYATGPGGVWVVSPEGEKLGRIPVQGPTNVGFGGDDARTLYITAGERIYSVPLATPGVLPGPERAGAPPAAPLGTGR
ncbi:MAG: SMP-30/gluconolactonase/LRE family protein [Phycisphaerales bacterium]